MSNTTTLPTYVYGQIAIDITGKSDNQIETIKQHLASLKDTHDEITFWTIEGQDEDIDEHADKLELVASYNVQKPHPHIERFLCAILQEYRNGCNYIRMHACVFKDQKSTDRTFYQYSKRNLYDGILVQSSRNNGTSYEMLFPSIETNY